MKKRAAAAGLLVIVIVIALLWLVNKSDRNPVVARVGDMLIHAREAKLRDEVIAIYYPGDDRSLGLDQLVRAATAAQILKNHGRPLTHAALEAEAERIDSHTLMPAMLGRIKGLFGSDHEAYLRVYVLPVLAERTLYYDFFLHDPEAQQESIARATAFLKKVTKAPETFRHAAEAEGLAVSEATVTPDGGLVWSSPESHDQRRALASESSSVPVGLWKELDGKRKEEAAAEGQRWLDEVVRSLKPGEVYQKVVDRGGRWLVVRYTGPSKATPGGHSLETIAFPKTDFSTWLDGEKKKVPVSLLEAR